MIVDIGKYYLYRHIRLDTNQVFYIGIGSKIERQNGYATYQRAYSKTGRNNFWKRITSKTTYEVEIILESNDYEFIKQKEIEFINIYGKRNSKSGTLVNLTDGGDGTIGLFYYTNIEIIEKFKQKHGDKYDYSLFDYKGYISKSLFICKEHGEFLQTSETHLRSGGCPKCGQQSRSRRDAKIRNYAKTFIDKLKNIYGMSISHIARKFNLSRDIISYIRDNY